MNPADAQYYHYPQPVSGSAMDIEIIVSLVERIGLPAVILRLRFGIFATPLILQRKSVKKCGRRIQVMMRGL